MTRVKLKPYVNTTTLNLSYHFFELVQNERCGNKTEHSIKTRFLFLHGGGYMKMYDKTLSVFDIELTLN